MKELLNMEKIACEISSHGFPKLRTCETDCSEFVGFNYMMNTNRDTEHVGIHFFIDDYQFERVWRSPERYMQSMRKFMCAMTPDFSLYVDMPEPLQMFNHYRKQWVGAYWQANLLDVIPTVSWSDAKSFSWCFEGIPKYSQVAISSVGTQRSTETKRLFLRGYEKMMEILNPTKILFYGKVPNECTGNIIRLESFQERFGGKHNGR